MTTCAWCRRPSPVTWAIDGTEAALCSRCLVRALREAEQAWVAERMARLFKKRLP